MSYTTLPRRSETFESAHGIGSRRRRRPISNLMADRLLTERPLRDVEPFPIWTGTIVAYPERGGKFQDTLEFMCRPFVYALDTSEFRGERGIALVFEDFELRPEGNFRIFVPRGELTALRSFPQEPGWYGMEPESGIPVIESRGPRRFLFRTEAARVGAASRDYGHEGKSSLDVYLHHRPTQKLGAILRAPEASGVVGASVVRLENAVRK